MKQDIAVVGGGLIGATAALSLDHTFPGRVLHLAPRSVGDERTTALLAESIAMLRDLDVWDAVEPSAAPLRVMRLLDGSRRLLRPRPLDFASSEIGLPQFGYNIRNDDLIGALGAAGGPERRLAAVTSAKREAEGWHLELDDGSTIEARALVAADGRNSIIRDAAGIETRRWAYDQVALVTTFAHERPHAGVSAEFHTETGPFTQVPLPPKGNAMHRSSLVWVVKPSQASTLEALAADELSRRIAERMDWMFGEVSVERTLSGYPLSGMIARTFGRDGVFLVGEAAHVFPPIGAQGANLGFRDVADCVAALSSSPDPVAASLAYDRNRSMDVSTRTTAVDLLNRSILTSFLPVQMARTLGTGLVSRSEALRRRLMKAGLAPTS